MQLWPVEKKTNYKVFHATNYALPFEQKICKGRTQLRWLQELPPTILRVEFHRD